MEVLQAKNLKKIYGSGNNAVHALDGVDLSVKKGEFVAIVGHIRLRQIHAAAHAGRAGSPYKWHGHGGRTGYFLPEGGSADHLPPQENRLCVPSI